MYSKLWTATSLALALALQANAHAAVAPVLGLVGQPVRKDVKRPNGINPCGAGVNIASEIDSSTAAPADANGVFNTVVSNFNLGLDGSRQVKAAMDPTGTGASFSAISVTTNGDLRSKDFSSQPIVAALPPGTVCTGGATKNKCLVQFKNAAGFGNCVVVSQDNSASSTAAAAVATAAATAALASAVAPPDAIATAAATAALASAVAPPDAIATAAATAALASAVAPPDAIATAAATAALASAVAPPAAVATGTAAAALAGTVAPPAAAPAVAPAGGNKGLHARGGTPAARAVRAEMEGRSL